MDGWTPAFCSHHGHTLNVKPRFTGDHHICCFFFSYYYSPCDFPFSLLSPQFTPSEAKLLLHLSPNVT